MLAERPTIAERVRGDRRARRGRRPHAGDRRRRRGRRVRRARAPARRRRALHRRQRGARHGRLRRRRDARDRRPDRRLAERQARACPTTRSRSPSPTARRWPTSSSATSTTSGPARSGWPSAARARSSTASALDPSLGERRTRDGRLELVGIESADPRWVRDAADALVEHRPPPARDRLDRVTLCQVAAARLDGMATLRGCRAVDAAAGQLIVREAGGARRLHGAATTRSARRWTSRRTRRSSPPARAGPARARGVTRTNGV